MDVRLPKIITRRRAKWTGLAATVCLAAAMITSYWYRPRFVWTKPDPPTKWIAGFGPGSVFLTSVELGDINPTMPSTGWELGSRKKERQIFLSTPPASRISMTPFEWRPAHRAGIVRGVAWKNTVIPLWMPFILTALPTGVLFYRDRKPKPGCCAKCRYDLAGLAGLSSDKCPECGTPTSPTATNSQCDRRRLPR